MITKQIEVNGTEFHLTLTDQVINQVNNLKSLYAAAYEDPESFEQVSSEISSAIQEIATAAEPEATDSDLDGLIQEIIKVVDNKAAEIEQELKEHTSKAGTKSSRSTKKGPKSKK
jgi:archaellum component FlaC